MKKQTLETIKQFAMGLFLSDWGNKRYEDVIESLNENRDDDDILIWQPLEYERRENIAEHIEMVREGIEEIIKRETK